MSDAFRPLQGLRIVELASYVAGPTGGLTLAELGAEVIRIDPIGGPADRTRWPLAPTGASLYWSGLNKGKRSMTLDLRRPEGRDLLAHIVAGSGPGGGIVLTNNGQRPGQRYDDFVELRPDVIHLAIGGSSSGRTAVDYTVDASTGFPLITGPVDQTAPAMHVLPAWDVICGLYASVGILAAERRRRVTGEGTQLCVSLEDVALATAGNLGYLAEAQFGVQRERLGNGVYGMYARTFDTADRAAVMVVLLSARHLRDLVGLTGVADAVAAIESALGIDFGDEQTRYAHRGLLDGLLVPWFAARTSDDVEAALATTSMPWARYRSFAEVAGPAGSALLDNPMFASVDQPGVGSYVAPGSPLRAPGTPGPVPAPVIGSHAGEVLADLLGLPEHRIADLRAQGVIG